MSCRSKGAHDAREDAGGKTPGGARRRGLAVAGVVAAAVIACLLLYRVSPFYRTPYDFDEAAADGGFVATVAPEIVERAQEVARQMEKSQSSRLNIQINAEPEADPLNGRCNLMIGNPKENELNLRVTLSLDADGEILYQSPVLKPGERLAYVTLSQIPQQGEHAATAEFAAFDAETGETVGAVDAGILLRVR